jgi:hypothetical protein
MRTKAGEAHREKRADVQSKTSSVAKGTVIMSDSTSSPISRRKMLRWIATAPFVALGLTATLSPAQAADNKKQFKYQDKPGRGGAKCSGCRFFRAPHGCSIVTGTISPNGWCIAWAKR